MMKIKAGGTLLCKQERKSSLTPLYDPDPMVVVGVKGSMMTSKDDVKIRGILPIESCLKMGARNHFLVIIRTMKVHLSPQMLFQWIGHVNFGKVKSSPEKIVAQWKSNLGREQISQDQTVKQNQDMRPVIGREGK